LIGLNLVNIFLVLFFIALMRLSFC